MDGVVYAQLRLQMSWADDVESELLAHMVDVAKYALKVAGLRGAGTAAAQGHACAGDAGD